MQFSHQINSSNNKASRFALIAGLHVVLGILFVQGLNVRTLSLTKTRDLEVHITPDHPVTPPPLDPPTPHTDVPPPKVFIPPMERLVLEQPQQPTIATTSTPDVAPMRPVVATDSTALPPATPPSQNTKPARMRTAVLADARACALPDYPARAAREGVSGTTMLALLVGVDGRVTSARVERSSGSRDLDRAALAALSLCRFQPATSNGMAEAGWAELGYVWKLDE